MIKDVLSPWICALGCILTTAAVAADSKAPDAIAWPSASPEALPRWRGFNLLEKFQLGNGHHPFSEADFRMISKLGFNFVRLPMDYRLWIVKGDWEQFDEGTLQEIDQAVEWGRQYGIHVCLNFHRAPGYTVAKPSEQYSLWRDAEAQKVCALHWGKFARRYRGIPSERLSFNLMNEPAGVSSEDYLRVVRKLVGAIRAEDPSRLIISDGLDWGTKPVPELRELRVAQATRGYAPFELTHYQASWAGGERFPLPEWPRLTPPNGTLMGPEKKEGSHALNIAGPFPSATLLRLRVLVVSHRATLVVEADGKAAWEKLFVSGPGEGEWKEARYKPEYQIYQNLFDRDYTCTIPAGTRQVGLLVKSGDWLQIAEVGIQPAGQESEDRLKLAQGWAEKPPVIRYTPGAKGGPFGGLASQDREWLRNSQAAQWRRLKDQGVGVMVGEWGAFNRTPHAVFVRWAEDCLANWKEAGFGWALWNFRGPFGVLDSGRADVEYEEWEGHKLDRKLLELLQRN